MQTTTSDEARRRGDERARARHRRRAADEDVGDAWRERQRKAEDLKRRAARPKDLHDELRRRDEQLGGCAVRDRVMSALRVAAELRAPALHVAGNELAQLARCAERQIWYVTDELQRGGFVQVVHTWDLCEWTDTRGKRPKAYSRKQRRNLYVLTSKGRDRLGLPTVRRAFAAAVDKSVSNPVNFDRLHSNAFGSLSLTPESGDLSQKAFLVGPEDNYARPADDLANDARGDGAHAEAGRSESGSRAVGEVVEVRDA